MAGCNVKHPCRSFQKRSETKTRFGNADGTSSNQSLFILPQYASWPDNLGDYVSLNGLDACQETTLVNANVSSDRTANGCSVEPKSVIRLWGDCPLVSCSMLLA